MIVELVANVEVSIELEATTLVSVTLSRVFPVVVELVIVEVPLMPRVMASAGVGTKEA